MANLIAYIPVLHAGYLKWLKSHPDSDLLVISQDWAESVLPRLARNIPALPTELVVKMIQSTGLVRSVRAFSPSFVYPRMSYVMPDEDVSHEIYERYMRVSDPYGVSFETIFLRWDMSAVIANQPVIADVVSSTESVDLIRMGIARRLKKKSPDWFRQIGAVAFKNGGEMIACAYNTHSPTEYEAYVFGDPALNRDAGTKTKISLALHAEQAIVAGCAKDGISLKGSSIYVTTFPCPDCARVIVQAGVSKIFFEEGYSLQDAQRILKSAGVQIVHLKNPESV